MKMKIDQDWLRRVSREDDDPSGCPACGAIAGCCDAYPDCPGYVEPPTDEEMSLYGKGTPKTLEELKRDAAARRLATSNEKP